MKASLKRENESLIMTDLTKNLLKKSMMKKMKAIQMITRKNKFALGIS